MLFITTNCNNVPTLSLSFSELCFHTDTPVYKNVLSIEDKNSLNALLFYIFAFFGPDVQHTDDPDVDRQRCSKYLHF